jgi:hypothetical protein
MPPAPDTQGHPGAIEAHLLLDTCWRPKPTGGPLYSPVELRFCFGAEFCTTPLAASHITPHKEKEIVEDEILSY